MLICLASETRDDVAAETMTPRLLDAKAAGELLGVPPTWLLAQARKDGIPHLRLGKYVRFDPDDLAGWITTQKRPVK
jgi:hypothetical protein